MKPIVEPVIFTGKAFDAHFHSSREHDVEESIELFKREMKLIGLEKILLLSITFHAPSKYDYDSNLKNACIKEQMSPNVYVSASVKHFPEMTEEEEAESLLRQAQEFYQAGFDGMKFLDAHPTIRKIYGPLTGKRYEKCLAFLEENNIPITMHNADPRSGWDISKCTQWEIDHGRVYDSSLPSFEECRDDIMLLMKKFPKLNLSLAHGGFLNMDPDKPYFEKFLGDYENTSVDLTGGPGCLYANEPDFFKPFIEKYQDKFIYGSDTYNSAPYDYENWESDIQYRPRVSRDSLMSTKKYCDYAGTSYNGMGLDKKICEKIFYSNAIKRWGATPKKTDMKWVEKEIEWNEKFYKDHEFKSNDIKKIKKLFEK